MASDTNQSAETVADATDRQTQLGHLAETLFVLFGSFLFAWAVVRAIEPAVGGLTVIPGTNADAQILQTVVQFVAIAAVVSWYNRVVREGLIRAVVPDRRATLLIVGGILTLVATNYGITAMFDRLGFESGTNAAVAAGAGDPTYFLAMTVVSVFFVGPAEELLFRGAIQGRLRDSWGVWPAIIGATLLFGSIHVLAVSGGRGAVASYVLTAAILGVLLGYLYERTDNIVVPAVVHGVNNAVIFAWLYLGEIGVV